MPSSPLPPGGGGARAALAGLTPPRSARSSPARPGRAAAASAPHPLPGRRGDWEGARTKCGSSSRPGGGRSAGPRRLGLLLLLPLTPLPPLSTCGAPGQGGGGARTEPDDNCQLEAPLGGLGLGGGEEGRGGAERRGRLTGPHSTPPYWGKERVAVAIHDAHAY